MKSWYLDRRMFLKGTGVALGLPWLDCMAEDQKAKQESTPKRFCAFYFPFGVGLPKEDGKKAQWRWFPKGEGRDFEFTETLKPLEPVRNSVSVLGGLSHPNGRGMGGHDTGDIFLTASELRGRYFKNGVSVDQVAAATIGKQTRFPSLVMSTDGGVGEPTRTSTLSFNQNGNPIPAINQPQTIFDRLFGTGDAGVKQQRRRLLSAGSMLDQVLDHSRSLRRQLGVQDKKKMDEYLSSVRQIEERVKRSQAWLTIPRPALTDDDRALLHLESDDEAPNEYIRTMYDLIYLAFRTDSTRLATYQIASMGDFTTKGMKFPQLLGFNGTLHKLAHGWNKPEGAEDLGKWDQFMAGLFADFLQRLQSAPEGEGTLLDNTMAFYGSSNSETHNNSNYPLLFAGGNGLGLQHNQFLKFDDKTPLSNLFVTVLDRLDVPVESFVDSSGEMSDVLA